MADDEKIETTEEPEVEKTAETTPEPEAAATPAETAEETEAAEAPVEDEAVAEPTAEAAAEEAPVEDEAVAEPTAEEAPAAAPKTKSRRHVPRSERRTRTKAVREKPKKRKSITRTEKPEGEPGRRQERRGIVVSDKGDKTIVVKVDLIKSHPKYRKVVRSTVKFHAHDEENTAGVGDTVRIVETRPLSALKRWRLAEIVEKAR
jgi:small subunit ribosomal protein S17